MTEKKYDLIIIGAGPGGYVAAIRAAQLDLNVALIEKNERLGGTCLNIGCIPSKALLDISEEYAKIKKELPERGILVDNLRFDLQKIMEQKTSIVNQLTDGLVQLMKANGVDTFSGTGTLHSKNSVRVKSTDGTKTILEGAAILLATGSQSVELPFLPFSNDKIVSSTEALSFESVPEHLIVIGAGAIGLEMASVWSRLGAQVTVLELLPNIIPGADVRVSKMLKTSLTKQGITFHLNVKVNGYEMSEDDIIIKAIDAKDKTVEITGDKVLVAVGRKPYLDGVGLEVVGLERDKKTGKIPVNERFQTAIDSIYAIGDLIEGPMLAHKAEDEGAAVAEILAGKPGHVNYMTIPNIVYTWPEVAMVGKTEEQLKEEGIPYKSGMFNFRANGRALCMGSTDGFVKVLADAETDSLLGVHILGPWASDLIMEAVTVMEFGGSAEDIARTVHGHPTLSEVVREAAMAVDNWSIHSVPPRKKK